MQIPPRYGLNDLTPGSLLAARCDWELDHFKVPRRVTIYSPNPGWRTVDWTDPAAPRYLRLLAAAKALELAREAAARLAARRALRQRARALDAIRMPRAGLRWLARLMRDKPVHTGVLLDEVRASARTLPVFWRLWRARLEASAAAPRA